MSTPLVFKSISLRNFMSFGNAESVIELDGQGTVTVTGENFDQGGSNGSGKTTIINALCYALYNKPFDNITLQRLINTTNATKNTQMEVRLVFEKDGIEYEIYRARGEDYRIEVRKDGEDITPGKGVYETDDLIQEIIGISYELFTKTIIFSGNAQPFLQLPIHFQRNQIEELFNITMLSEKAKQLKDLIRITEADIKVAEAVVKQQEVAIELHKKHVNEAEIRIERWDVTRQTRIRELEARAEKRRNSTVDLDEQHALRTESNRLTGVVRPALEKKLQPLRYKFEQLETRAAKLLKEQAHLEEAKCPYCSQDFAGSAQKLLTIQEEIETVAASMEDYLRVIAEVEVQYEMEVTIPLEAIQAKLVLTDKEYLELVQADKESRGVEEQLASLQAEANPHTEAYEKLLDERIDQVNTSKVDSLRHRLNHQQFLLKLLTDKTSFLRRRIINKTIPFLNNRLNFYTNSLGLPHVVKFDADMSCTVAEFGRELDFGNLSAGEKKRVNTAMALAFRDVLHHLHAKTNLLIIDELDGGLDQQGIDSIIKILKEKSRDEDMSVFIISHHPAIQGRLDRDLKIRKENGFSSVVFD
jgi:DNA repair exonuclease SbcCD ATPase subunit